ncbi:hypothetical protein [Kitasatospora sp. NBC_01539]|uniref:hypothetical protein n=1 Tax=Kitasatospora sp. NBC_01539 TaxID=2903577 RepID=UPI0038601F30
MITQGVTVTTRCTECGGVLMLDIGQFVERGRLCWGTEGYCLSCSVAWCDQDSGDETPEEIRRALLAEHGPARLRLTDPEARMVPVLRALREVYGLTLPRARVLATELRTAGLVGTFVEMELLASRLRHLAVEVAVGTESG